MTTDPIIREQAYPYFLQEVPELLQVLEQGFLELREDCGIHQINTLMRATHTLKGVAASVGLETISIIAHSLEDIFRALCLPNLSIDAEVAALLFEGFECLRLPLTAELTGGAINDAEVLDRATPIFSQLQEKLADFLGQEVYLPSSVELGFDVTLSIFETGVAQRLEQLATTIAHAHPEQIIFTLQSQAEVFLGLAESLNLPGFGAIAQTAIAALNQRPGQAVTIAQAALADFQAGQAAVLAGDRTQGGQPSETLRQLAEPTITPSPDDASNLTGSPNEPDTSRLLESIWGKSADSTASIPTPESASESLSLTASSLQPHASPENRSLFSQTSPSQSQPSDGTPTAIPKRNGGAASPLVRVSVENLEHLSTSIGELLTNQNQQSLTAEQLQASVKTLLTRLQQQQQLLHQLQEQLSPESSRPERRQAHYPRRSKVSRRSRMANQPLANAQSRRSTPTHRLTTLDLDDASDSHLLAQSLADSAVQLAEVADAIDLFTRQSKQTLEVQQRLLTGTRDALIEARMLSLGEIFDRLPRVLQQLETQHNKPAALALHGTDVLADKVVAEKLYEPLLHLVRNAFDHGIEPAAIRRQHGKAATGQIEIGAYHQGRYLVIEVRDDGAGLDFERIRQWAVEHQFVSSEQVGNFTPAQLTDLLFEPGFSTAAQVNQLSGRGVGLDVVRNQVHALQGSIAVHSERYQGTTFKLQIPLKLTIAKLLICQVDATPYALFADTIEQILVPQPGQLCDQYGIKVLLWGNGAETKQVPIYSLQEAVPYASAIQARTLQHRSATIHQPFVKHIILFRYQDALLGLEVDQLLGEQELVIRPLGSMIRSPHYVYGATVLADSQLTLVLDPIALIQHILNRQGHGNGDRTIPLMQPSPPPLQLSAQPYAALPTSSQPDPPTKPNQRILVVDDSITVRQMLALTLQKAGYSVSQAVDGQDAIEKLQAQPNVQLVICDLDMPRVNGFEFLRHCQSVPALMDIPVLILTSRSDEKHRLLAAQLGARAYMTKPYLEYKLLDMVAEMLEINQLNSMSE